MFYRFLTSVRLTIFLLLALALVSIVGTLLKVEANRFDIFYQTPWFRVLLVLLAANIAACTWKTWRRNLADRQRFIDLLTRRQSASEWTGSSRSVETLQADLKSAGFRMRTVEGGQLATRGRLGRWGSTIVHLSLLIILLGGILSELGFVGTLTLPVGQSSSVYFSWDHEVDLPLNFTIRLDRFEIDNYPVDVRFGVYNPQTRAEIDMITAREGDTIDLPLPGVSAKVVHFEPFDQTLVLEIFRGGEMIGLYRTPSSKSQETKVNFLDPLLLIRLTGFKDPMVRQFQSQVSILEQGRVVATGVVEANRPFVYEGVAIYQTAFHQDKFGFWTSGFQLSKDPGEPLVWGGSILLIIGLGCAFGLRYRVLAIVDDEFGSSLYPLSGFNDVRGGDILARLQDGSDSDD